MSSPSDDLPGLDHYALKSMDYGQLTGLSIGCHAIPDCFLLMHVGVGCKNKATAHLMVHDWQEHANIREGWTEVGDADLILGSSTRAAPYLRSWYKRMEPGLMVTTSVTFIDLAGEDVVDHLERAAKDLPCPVLFVKTPGYTPDLYRGYAKLVFEVMKGMPWKQASTEPGQVTVLGYLFDRYEGDHKGNLTQIRGLLKMVGLSLGPVLLSGTPYDELMTAWRSEFLVELPYLRPVRRKLKRKLKSRERIGVDLPMGIRGTSRWVRTIAEATGRLTPRVEALLERRERYVWEQLDTMLDRWRSLAVMVVAEPPLAAGLCSLLIELGLSPVYVGLRGSSLGGEAAFTEALARDGFTLPEGAVVVEDPSLDRLRTAMADGIEAGELDLVFGSSTELNMLSTLAPKTHVREHVRGRLLPEGPRFVEIGFPCRDHHAVLPMPFMGYGGVVVMAQRIIDARRLWDTGRTPTFPG